MSEIAPIEPRAWHEAEPADVDDCEEEPSPSERPTEREIPAARDWYESDAPWIVDGGEPARVDQACDDRDTWPPDPARDLAESLDLMLSFPEEELWFEPREGD